MAAVKYVEAPAIDGVGAYLTPLRCYIMFIYIYK